MPDHQLLIAKLPTGLPAGLEIVALSGREELSRLPVWYVQFRSKSRLKASLVGKAIRDKQVKIGVLLSDGSRRTVGGIVNRYAVRGREFQIELVSHLQWALQYGEDSKVFVNQTVRQIIAKVLDGRNLKEYFQPDSSLGSGQPRQHCVIYKESPLRLVLRLIEEEGWFFRFDWEASKGRLVVADGKAGYANLPNLGKVKSVRVADGVLPSAGEVAWLEPWGKSRPGGNVYANAFSWVTPQADMVVSSEGEINGRPQPGICEYIPYTDTATGRRLARWRQQRERTEAAGITGTSGSAEFTAGGMFQLGQGKYLITSVHHQVYNGIDGNNSAYCNHFKCIPAKITFRPRRIYPKPTIPGVLTGLVVGQDGKDSVASGSDVHADEMCRVKVRLGFDRAWRKNKDTSILVRVGQSWVGNRFGSLSIPPIGTEVKLAFEEGDPDRPELISCNFNPLNLPPTNPAIDPMRYGLWGRPGHGSPVDASLLTFDDRKGNEAIEILSSGLIRILAARGISVNATNGLTADAKTAVFNFTEKLEIHVGKCSIILTKENITLKVGKSTLDLTEKEMRLLATKIFLNC